MPFECKPKTKFFITTKADLATELQNIKEGTKMPFECKPKTKFFITTKADLATDKVNEWLEENYDHIDVVDIKPFMSYTSAGDRLIYMIGCMILYLENPSRNEHTSL